MLLAQEKVTIQNRVSTGCVLLLHRSWEVINQITISHEQSINLSVLWCGNYSLLCSNNPQTSTFKVSLWSILQHRLQSPELWHVWWAETSRRRFVLAFRLSFETGGFLPPASKRNRSAVSPHKTNSPFLCKTHPYIVAQRKPTHWKSCNNGVCFLVAS